VSLSNRHSYSAARATTDNRAINLARSATVSVPDAAMPCDYSQLMDTQTRSDQAEDRPGNWLLLKVVPTALTWFNAAVGAFITNKVSEPPHGTYIYLVKIVLNDLIASWKEGAVGG
jgi:hypothetical protein